MGMPEFKNVLLLAGDALLYFAALAALFRGRRRLGIGAFFCALGVMHFLETYLAAIFYVSLPLGIVTSPGSTVLFAGKLMFLLLVYIREDAVVVRQPIYGLLIGNLLIVVLASLMRNHELVSIVPGRVADFGFLGEMGALMLWGTAILFVDAIMIILVYEKSRTFFGDRIFLRLGAAGAVVLTFDQLAFFAGLHVLTGAGSQVLVGGWIAKMAAVSLYTILVGAYLYWLERPRPAADAPRISDVFDLLTYRERYEDLLARSGRDALTGAFDRGRLETHGRRMIEEADHLGLPASLLLIDIDHFKSYNDRFGHAAGDAALKRIAAAIMSNVRTSDCVFRFGGEEFVVVCKALGSEAAVALGERIRREIASQSDPSSTNVTVSVGVANMPTDARVYDLLFAAADARLYKAKAAGRNCVVGSRAATDDTRLATAF
jgi:diguanylate cyclase (GGDEF)-like protein